MTGLCRAEDRPAEPQPDLLLGCLSLHLGMREACQCPCRTRATGQRKERRADCARGKQSERRASLRRAGAPWGGRALAGSGKELRCCLKSRGDMATLPAGGPSSPSTPRWEVTGGGWFASKEAGQEEEGLSRFWEVLASGAMVCFCPGPALRPSRPPRSHPGAGQASASSLQGRLLAGHRVPYQFLSGPGVPAATSRARQVPFSMRSQQREDLGDMGRRYHLQATERRRANPDLPAPDLGLPARTVGK